MSGQDGAGVPASARGAEDGTLAAARRATEPSDAEVRALLRRLPPEPARPTVSAWAWLAPAAVAAAVVLLWARPAPYGPAPAAGEVLALSAVERELGPSIMLGGDAVVEVVAAGPGGTRLRLRAGRVVARVDPEGPHRALAIEAPGGVTASVLGTVFAVEWDAAGGRGAVSVERGAVAVTDPAGSRRLGAGERFAWGGMAGSVDEADGDAASERRDVGADRVRGVEAGADPAGSGGFGGDPAGSGASSLAGAGARSGPADSAGSSDAAGRGTPRTNGRADAAAPLPSPGGAEAMAALDPRAPPAGAHRPERSGVDLSAARALVAVQIALDEGRDGDAVRLADDLLRAAPDGPLAQEAGALRVEALAASDPAGAVAAASLWLAWNAGHPRALDVLRLRATLARDHLRDCALAHPADAALAAASQGEEQARAWALAGLCAANAGAADAARLALDAALVHPDLPAALAPRVRAARRDLPEAHP